MCATYATTIWGQADWFFFPTSSPRNVWLCSFSPLVQYIIFNLFYMSILIHVQHRHRYNTPPPAHWFPPHNNTHISCFIIHSIPQHLCVSQRTPSNVLNSHNHDIHNTIQSSFFITVSTHQQTAFCSFLPHQHTHKKDTHIALESKYVPVKK